MKKAICNKCNKLIRVDEKQMLVECPECHEQINSEETIKQYNRTVNLYKKRAELAFLGSTDYPKAFDYYSKLLGYAENALTVLTAISLAKLYCSNLHNVTIKEATDILIKGSDKVEINNDNVKLLSEFLKKFKEDSLLIIKSLSNYKSKSKYSYNLYLKAVNEYIYYLNAYLDIYNSLDKLNKYFVENKEMIDEAIKSANDLLNEKVNIKNNSETKIEYFNNKHKPVIDIFPNYKLIYKIRMCLYGSMGVGFILAIVGLIMLSTNKGLASSLIAGIGLAIFIGSYFAGHYLRRKTYHTTW